MTFDRDEFRRQVEEREADDSLKGIPWGTYICRECGMMQIRDWPWPEDNPCNDCLGTLVPSTPPASERRG